MQNFIRLGHQQLINVDAIDYIYEYDASFYIYCFGKLIIVQRNEDTMRIINGLNLYKQGITLININNIKSVEEFNETVYLYFPKTAIKLPKTADNNILNHLLNN